MDSLQAFSNPRLAHLYGNEGQKRIQKVAPIGLYKYNKIHKFIGWPQWIPCGLLKVKGWAHRYILRGQSWIHRVAIMGSSTYDETHQCSRRSRWNPCGLLKVKGSAHGLTLQVVYGFIEWALRIYRFPIETIEAIGGLRWIPCGLLKVKGLAHRYISRSQSWIHRVAIMDSSTYDETHQCTSWPHGIHVGSLKLKFQPMA